MSWLIRQRGDHVMADTVADMHKFYNSVESKFLIVAQKEKR